MNAQYGKEFLVKPNIVFVQIESLDGRALGYMGEPGAYTPNLDRLAKRGAVFEQAYCNSPQCVPSRSSMWSGRYVWQVGAWNNYRGLPKNEQTFVDDLEDAGYQCAVLGRTDHHSGSHSVSARMSAWVRSAPDGVFRSPGPKHTLKERGRRQREHDWESLDRAREWLENEREQGSPFFMHLGLMNTHPGGGYRTSQYWLENIEADKVSMPPREAPETHPAMQRMIETKGCDREFSEDFVFTCRRHYLAMIAETDGIVGELVEELETRGELDNTVIIFTADHGDMRMEHGQWLKNCLYEGSARVPMIIAGPGVSKNHRVKQPVSLIDVYPTLMDLAGAEGRDDLTGHSLVPAAHGRKSGHPGIVLSEYHSNFQQTGSFMLRRGPWKYIKYIGYRPQLFNVETDPDEIHDLVEEEPGVVAELDGELENIVDTEAVDAAAKATDAAEFATWKLRFAGDDYLKGMSKVATVWNKDIEKRFKEWAEKFEAGVISKGGGM